MGFFQNLMTGLFAKQTQAATEAWGKDMTDEEIAHYEKQGLDMTEIRKIRDAELERKRQLVERSLAAQDLSKLDAYKEAIPAGEFAEAVVKLNRIPEKRMAEALLVYSGVVQAHWALWEPQQEDSSTGMVLVFAVDEAHRFDTEWLGRTAETIQKMKAGEIPVPVDAEKFIKTLRDDQSWFCFPLGETLGGGADGWCATFMDLRKQSVQLPLGYLPASRILPIVLTAKPRTDHADIQLVPPVYYTK